VLARRWHCSMGRVCIGDHVGPMAVRLSAAGSEGGEAGNLKVDCHSPPHIPGTVSLPSHFQPAPSPHARPNLFEIWPTSVVGGRGQVVVAARTNIRTGEPKRDIYEARYVRYYIPLFKSLCVRRDERKVGRGDQKSGCEPPKARRPPGLPAQAQAEHQYQNRAACLVSCTPSPINW
jgi:hypothetical protein